MAKFEELVGKTLTEITRGYNDGDDWLQLRTSNDLTFRMNHVQDCCENVRLESVVGDIDDLIGHPLLTASERVSVDGCPAPEGECPPESYTWTFYILATIKGTVTLRWLGESNGYYSESVDFTEMI